MFFIGIGVCVIIVLVLGSVEKVLEIYEKIKEKKNA